MSAWKTARLEEVAEVLGGGTPSRQVNRFFGGDIAWATPTDVTALDGLYITNTKETVTEDGLKNSSTKLMPPGTVILTSRATIGFSAVATTPICTNQGFVNFICSKELLPEYLAYWLRTQKAKMLQHAGGTTFKEIARGTLRKFEISFPNIEEQRRIVDIISRAEGIARLRREAHKKADAIGPAIFTEMFGDPAINPKGWPMQRIDTLCSVQTGATPRRENNQFFDGGTVAWVKTGEVCGTSITKSEEFITQLAIDKTNCKIFPSGTILIAMYGQGQTRGRAGILSIPATTNQACAAILPSVLIERLFLFSLLNMQYERLRAMGRGGNQANLNLGMIKSLEVPVPPLAAQQDYITKLAALNSIKSQQLAATKKAKAAFDALLSQIFSRSQDLSQKAPHKAAVAT